MLKRIDCIKSIIKLEHTNGKLNHQSTNNLIQLIIVRSLSTQPTNPHKLPEEFNKYLLWQVLKLVSRIIIYIIGIHLCVNYQTRLLINYFYS